MGLVMSVESESVEPMAKMVASATTAHRSLLNFVEQLAWSDEAMVGKVRYIIEPAFVAHGGVKTCIIDDTSFQKKGSHSEGVARQYCGRLGKTVNCQIAVTLSLANHHMRLPVCLPASSARYLGEGRQATRQGACPRGGGVCNQAGIALSQFEAALKTGLARGVVLADASFDNQLRARLTALGLSYAVGLADGGTAVAA